MRKRNPIEMFAWTAIFPLFFAAAHSPPKVQQKIPVAEIGKGVQLIGRLGHPLGTMVTLTGTWAYPDQSKGPTKIYDLQFTIRTVNGEPLMPPLVVDVWLMHVLDKNKQNAIPSHDRHAELAGASWSIRGYETGRYTVTPDEYWKFRGPITMRPSPVFESSIVGFTTERR